ncbi:trehalose-phosphatase [Sandaracinobacteroides sp. A072]|uniref:trehalose-phosphatase n=1 Tax=Sandaracinobacteroides sp. A072 TaxID=3461146 RepID=UPI004042844F
MEILSARNGTAGAVGSGPGFAPGHAPGLAPPALGRGTALFLDFDGTLADLAPTPDAARMTDGMARALQGVQAGLDGRLAIVSGRSIAMLDRLVPVQGLALAGVHGLERRHTDGRIERPAAAPALDAARLRLAALAQSAPGLLLEDKGLALALHYRGAPELERLAREKAGTLARELGLKEQTGKMVIELRLPGADKGDAVAAFMAASPFRGAHPVFVGDDDTDESAFAAVQALGGHGIRVGPAPHGTVARHALPDVRSVERWLSSLKAAGQDSGGAP